MRITMFTDLGKASVAYRGSFVGFGAGTADNISLIYTLARRYSRNCSDSIQCLHTKRYSRNNGLNNESAESISGFFEEKGSKGKKGKKGKKEGVSESKSISTKNH
ncbi:hypothetical protein BELL_2395g00010 [Botrytis elliptica]|uniref:Uncharacterized protein n=1 Tax=Botrytis elliptica TaxID=278938 RepID=A0A4Z1H7I8_9HELO|nr:hypothetical protein BELL_2395g00010 [Botrytis elliptica]